MAIGGVIDGCPPGLVLSEKDIQGDLDRRRPGQSSYTTQRNEADKVQILSGVFDGKTLGTPIGILIGNQDTRSQDYESIKHQFRPGHGDFAYQKKYGHRDYRGGGRASARETAIRVAAGAIAKKYLYEKCQTTFHGFVEQIGEIKAAKIELESVHTNPFFFPDDSLVPALETYIKHLKSEGDSVGARVSVHIKQVPIGLGEPVFDKLDADLAHALMSINAVKGVEIGDGFKVIENLGSDSRDALSAEGFLSNHAGGVLAGISTGQELRLSMALKPTSSIRKSISTLDLDGRETKLSVIGRHDPCVGIRAVPIAEAMCAIVLLDHLIRHRGQNEVY